MLDFFKIKIDRQSPCLSFLLLIAKGLGNMFFMKISVGLALAHALLKAFSERNWFKLLIIISLCCLAHFQWSLVHLWGFWAFVLITAYGKNNLEALSVASSLLVLWLVQETFLGSWTVIPWLGIPFFLICYWGFKYLAKKHLLNKIFYVTLFCCAANASYDIFKINFQAPNIQISQDKNVMPVYTPGPMLAKILNGTLVKPGHVSGDIGISSMIFDKGPYFGSRHILLAEHDIEASDPNSILRKPNAQQIEPWAHNQLIGNQYLLEAIARDGLWMANLGGSLKPTGKLVLGSLSHVGDQIVTPLVVEYNNFTYVQDSDCFVDGLANRQENIIKEIVLGRSFPRVLNLIFCASLLILFTNPLSCLICRAFSIITICWFLLIPKEGDVRIVAKIDWPHEPSKASGVMASLVDSGYLMLLGSKNSQILVVGQGKTAMAKQTEKLVILEPGATVFIGKHLIRSSMAPTDDEHGVTDSRKLFINNEATSSLLFLDGVKVIGTGSPSKLEWGKWIG